MSRAIQIAENGAFSGKIRYGKMLVQEGGQMSGDIGALAPESMPPRSLGGRS